MLARIEQLLVDIGKIKVGREYIPGSIESLLGDIGSLFESMKTFNMSNVEIASNAWNEMFTGYAADLKEEQLKEQELKAFLGMGGFNGFVNCVSIATRGEELNVVKMMCDGIGNWYNVNVVKPIGDLDCPPLEYVLGFSAGFVGGAGKMVSSLLQMDALAMSKGLYGLATSSDVRKQFGKGISTWWKSLDCTNAYVTGEVTFDLVSLLIGGEFSGGIKVGKMGEATSILSKAELKAWASGEKLAGKAAGKATKKVAGKVLDAEFIWRSSEILGVKIDDIVKYSNNLKQGVPLTKTQISELAELAKTNPDAWAYAIGKFEANSLGSYEQVGYQLNSTSYNMGQAWEKVKMALSDGTDAGDIFAKDQLIEINRKVTQSQIDAGKDIILTHDPYGELTKSFEDEIDMITSSGKYNNPIKILIDGRELWIMEIKK
jgi:hypothetical protein